MGPSHSQSSYTTSGLHRAITSHATETVHSALCTRAFRSHSTLAPSLGPASLWHQHTHSTRLFLKITTSLAPRLPVVTGPSKVLPLLQYQNLPKQENLHQHPSLHNTTFSVTPEALDITAPSLPSSSHSPGPSPPPGPSSRAPVLPECNCRLCHQRLPWQHRTSLCPALCALDASMSPAPSRC